MSTLLYLFTCRYCTLERGIRTAENGLPPRLTAKWDAWEPDRFEQAIWYRIVRVSGGTGAIPCSERDSVGKEKVKNRTLENHKDAAPEIRFLR